MKGIGIALAFALGMQANAALADMELFIAQGALDAAQVQAASAAIERAAGEPVVLVTEEEDGRGFSARMMEGGAPQLAIVDAQEAAVWAKEGLLMALDGCDGMEEVSEAVLAACTADERLYAVPLLARERCMAVRVREVEAANMAHLLDEVAHPTWYPSEVLQILDELALSDGPGMMLWPPQDGDLLCFEAFLQGVCGSWFAPGAEYAREIQESALRDALVWMEEMTRAGLVAVAGSRRSALERFLDGETAIFIDWTAAETAAHQEEIARGEIVLMPYPAITGTPLRAGEVMAVCAPLPGDEDAAQAARLAVAALAQLSRQGKMPGARAVYGEAPWRRHTQTLAGGATLQRLLCEAAANILSGEEDARAAAARIVRALDAAR